MLQRIGLAQALLHDPELLILDEPMSGLDPIGRKEVRDLVAAERKRGKTVLFTSHILTDVERLCDRVAIMHRGKITAYGALGELLKPEVLRTEIELEGAGDALREKLAESGAKLADVEKRLVVVIEGDARAALEAALASGARVVAVHEQRETLEDLFVRDAVRTGGPSPEG
jgi:ABC-2 type transport system ATP-binding protein